MATVCHTTCGIGLAEVPNINAIPHPLKILMIHGYGQSGLLLDVKTRVIQRELERMVAAHATRPSSVQFHFPTAPFRVRPADFPNDAIPRDLIAEDLQIEPDSWTWCQGFISGTRNFYDESRVIPDLVKGLDAIADVIMRHGPFDGVIGFSSGASIAVLVASLLETGRRLAFDKQVSGGKGMAYPESFLGESASTLKFLQPPMKFASVIGQWDTVVSEQQSLILMGKSEGKPQVLYHSGSHYVPQQRYFVTEVVKFIMDFCFQSSVGAPIICNAAK